MKALCIGGPLDKSIVDVAAVPTDYRLEQIGKNGEATLSFYVADSLTTSAAFHMVFAAYAKKGK